MRLSPECEKRIVDFLVKEFDPQMVYLYGSFAGGHGRVDSDIDLAVYPNRPTDSYELFLVANELAMLLKRDVEIVDLRDVSTVLGAQIVSTGKVLYCLDEMFRANYEIRVFKDYAKLNEERSVILKAIREDGSIYGI